MMLVGFGLKDSITNIATLQYGELQEYDGMAYLSSDLSDQEKMSLRETLEGEHQIDTYSEVMMKNKTVKSAAGEGGNLPECSGKGAWFGAIYDISKSCYKRRI